MSKKKTDPMKLRRILILVTIILVAVLTGVNIWMAREVKVETAKLHENHIPPAPSVDGDTAGDTNAEGLTVGEAAIGGEFTGRDHHGKPFKFSDTHGTLTLVFFGFTHCPDICPTSLANITTVQEILGDDAALVTPILVTVDPKRDTSEVLKEYIANFHPSVIGITGSKAQIEAATEAFKVYHSKSEIDEHGDYIVDHSGFIYLMDPQGKYIAHFSPSDSPDKMVTAMKPHIKLLKETLAAQNAELAPEAASETAPEAAADSKEKM